MSASGSAWILAIDFGTTATAAATVSAGQIAMVRIDADDRMPSMVFWREGEDAREGELLLGELAERWAALAPECLERAPKRRMGDRFLHLGNAEIPVARAIGAILAKVKDAAVRERGGFPSALYLTHPARWAPDGPEIEQLREAASLAELPAPTLVPEPVAAAIHFATAELSVGEYVAVYDFGGGTFDTAVLRRTEPGFEVVGEPGGDEDLGGQDFDDRLYRWLGSQLTPEEWENLRHARGEGWPQANRELLQEARKAKEHLSRNADAPVFVPKVNRDILVTSEQLRELISGEVLQTVNELERTIATAGLEPGQLTAIYLAGGSSAIPLVTSQISQRLGQVPRTLDNPKTVVVRGAALLAAQAQTPIPASKRLHDDRTDVVAGGAEGGAGAAGGGGVGAAGGGAAGAAGAALGGGGGALQAGDTPRDGAAAADSVTYERTAEVGRQRDAGSGGRRRIPLRAVLPAVLAIAVIAGAVIVFGGLGGGKSSTSGGSTTTGGKTTGGKTTGGKTTGGNATGGNATGKSGESTNGRTSGSESSTLNAQQLVAAVASVPESDWEFATEESSYASQLTALEGEPLGASEPIVLFIGYEWCPHCVANSWALVEALGRFGTFEDVSELNSGTYYSESGDGPSSDDHIPGFNFDQSSYSSEYIEFEPYEAQNLLGESLEEVQEPFLAAWESLDSANGPVVDFDGRYWTSTPAFEPSILSGQDPSTVAAALREPSSSLADAINSEANVYTAVICGTLSTKPSVCEAQSITEASEALPL